MDIPTDIGPIAYFISGFLFLCWMTFLICRDLIRDIREEKQWTNLGRARDR